MWNLQHSQVHHSTQCETSNHDPWPSNLRKGVATPPPPLPLPLSAFTFTLNQCPQALSCLHRRDAPDPQLYDTLIVNPSPLLDLDTAEHGYSASISISHLAERHAYESLIVLRDVPLCHRSCNDELYSVQRSVGI